MIKKIIYSFFSVLLMTNSCLLALSYEVHELSENKKICDYGVHLNDKGVVTFVQDNQVHQFSTDLGLNLIEEIPQFKDIEIRQATNSGIILGIFWNGEEDRCYNEVWYVFIFFPDYGFFPIGQLAKEEGISIDFDNFLVTESGLFVAKDIKTNIYYSFQRDEGFKAITEANSFVCCTKLVKEYSKEQILIYDGGAPVGEEKSYYIYEKEGGLRSLGDLGLKEFFTDSNFRFIDYSVLKLNDEGAIMGSVDFNSEIAGLGTQRYPFVYHPDWGLKILGIKKNEEDYTFGPYCTFFSPYSYISSCSYFRLYMNNQTQVTAEGRELLYNAEKNEYHEGNRKIYLWSNENGYVELEKNLGPDQDTWGERLYGINDKGQVLGFGIIDNIIEDVDHKTLFVYDPNEGLLDLSKLIPKKYLKTIQRGVIDYDSIKFNNRGEILLVRRKYKPLLLTPINQGK